jgi:hypothetical protein
MKIYIKNLAAIGLLLLSAAGCMLGPYDGEDIKARKMPVSFGGTTFWPNDPITIQALNRSTNQWSTIATTKGDAQGEPDSAGHVWFMWAKENVTLPNSAVFWQTTGSGTSRKSTITTRAVSQNFGGPTNTFTNPAQQCALANLLVNDSSGIELINMCATGSTTKIDVPCGDLTEACCVQSPACNSTSASPLTCKSGLCVRPATDVVTTDAGMGVVDPDDQPCADVVGAPCMAPTPGCYSGTTSVMSTIKCVNNKPVCTKPVLRVDYCDNCDNSLCGGCPGAPCDFDAQCGPASFCNTYPEAQGGNRCDSHECQEKRDYCWLPKTTFMAPPPAGATSGEACARP